MHANEPVTTHATNPRRPAGRCALAAVVAIALGLPAALRPFPAGAQVGTPTPDYTNLLNLPIHDVRQHGAKPDDGADDAPAFTAAATQAAASRGVVTVPAGTFDILTTVVVPGDAVTLQGAGEGRTFLRAPAGVSFPVIDAAGRRDVTLRGFSIVKASGAAATSNGHGIRFTGASSSPLVEDVTVDGFVNGVHFAGDASGSPANQTYTVQVNPAVTSGNWRLGFVSPVNGTEAEWTADLAFNATAGAVQTALEALASIAPGDVAVAGAAPSYTVTFQGTLAGLYVPWFQASRGTLAGAANSFVMVAPAAVGGGPWITNPTLRRVTVLNSPASWGMHFDCVDGLILEGCRSRGHYFDGVKMRKHVRNWQIVGGDFSYNGTSWYASDLNGDGLDCHTGGERGRISLASFNHNSGSGLTIKNDDGLAGAAANDLSGYARRNAPNAAETQFGLTRKLDFDSIEASYNLINGLSVGAENGDASIAVTDLAVGGGQFEGNGAYGMLLQSVRAAVDKARCRRNGTAGIILPSQAKFVALTDVSCPNNGPSTGTGGYGLMIDGDDVTVTRGFFCGTDSDLATYLTDFAALANKSHISNIIVQANAARVTLNHPVAPEGTSTGVSVQVATGATQAIVHRSGALTPNTDALHGSLGSTYRVHSTGIEWTRTSGSVTSVTGWSPVVTTSGVNLFPSGMTWGSTPGIGTSRLLGAQWNLTDATGTRSLAEWQLIANPADPATASMRR